MQQSLFEVLSEVASVKARERKTVMCKGCTKTTKECAFAHNLAELVPPVAARALCMFDDTLDTTVSVVLPVPGLRFEPAKIDLRECFPSRLTRAFADPKLRGSLLRTLEITPTSVCRDWLINGGKCHFWSNCNFLHPSALGLKKAFRHRICPSKLDSNSPCEFGKTCPLAHSPAAMVAPDDYAPLYEDGTLHKRPLKFYSRRDDVYSYRDVPEALVMDTNGARGNSVQLCDAGIRCDFWSRCDFIHLFTDHVRDCCLRNEKLAASWARRLAEQFPLQPAPTTPVQLPAQQSKQPKQQQTSPAQVSPPQLPAPQMSPAPAPSPAPSPTPVASAKKKKKKKNKAAQKAVASSPAASPSLSVTSIDEPLFLESSSGSESPQSPSSVDREDIPISVQQLFSASRSAMFGRTVAQLLCPKITTTLSLRKIGRNATVQEMFSKAQSQYIKHNGRHSDTLQSWFESERAQAYPPPVDQRFPSGSEVFFTHPSLRIGKGSTAVVYAGLRVDGTPIALKVYNAEPCGDSGESSDDEEDIEQSDLDLDDTPLGRNFRAEVDSLKARAAIPGLVRYMGSCKFLETTTDAGVETVVRRRCIALELMEYSLTEVVSEWTKAKDVIGKPGHYEAVQYVVGSVLHTMLDLLKHNPDTSTMLVHRDLKPDNILFDRMSQVRIIDFGLVSYIRQNMQTTVSRSQTPSFAAPELISPQKAQNSSSMDLFSIGLLALHMFKGEHADSTEENHFPVWSLSSVVACEPGEHRTLSFREVPSAYRRAAAQHFIDLLVVRDPQTRALCHLLKGNTEPQQVHMMVLSHPMFWDSARVSTFICLLGNMPNYHHQSTRREFLGPLHSVVQAVLGRDDAWKKRLESHMIDKFGGEGGEDGEFPAMLFLRIGRNFFEHGHPSAQDALNYLNCVPALIPQLWTFLTLMSPSEVSRFHPALANFLQWQYSPTLSHISGPGTLTGTQAAALLFG